MFNILEFDELMSVVSSMTNIFALIGDYLSLSLNDIISNIGFSFQIPAWLGGDLTPLVLMVGIGLPTYIAYQFITWCKKVVELPF